MSALLHGRVALVTGGARGLGRTIAEALVAAGACVVIADSGSDYEGNGADPSPANEVAKTLGGQAIAFSDSVNSPEAAKAAVDLAVRSFGSVDILMNGAAIRRDTPVSGTDVRDWEAVIRANMSAPFYLMAAAVPAMRQGHIINILSAADLPEGAGQVASTAASAGLLGLTLAAARDLAGRGITVNAVKVEGEGAMCARLVVALCSPAAASITGRLLGMRGRTLLLFGQQRPAVRLMEFGDDTTGDMLLAALEREGAATTEGGLS